MGERDMGGTIETASIEDIGKSVLPPVYRLGLGT